MQYIIGLWCGLIGVTDPNSVQFAVGIVAAASVLFVVGLIIGLMLALIDLRMRFR